MTIALILSVTGLALDGIGVLFLGAAFLGGKRVVVESLKLDLGLLPEVDEPESEDHYAQNILKSENGRRLQADQRRGVLGTVLLFLGFLFQLAGTIGSAL